MLLDATLIQPSVSFQLSMTKLIPILLWSLTTTMCQCLNLTYGKCDLLTIGMKAKNNYYGLEASSFVVADFLINFKIGMLPCLAIVANMTTINEQTLFDMITFIGANKSKKKILILTNGNRRLIESYQTELNNVETHVIENGTTWTSCSFDRAFYKDIQSCELKPFWTRRRVQVSSLKKRNMTTFKDMFHSYAKTLKFNYDLIFLPKSSGWTDYVTMVGNGSFDLGMHPHMNSEHRQRQVDTIVAHRPSELVWISAPPKPILINMMSIFHVFDLNVWMSITGIMAIIVLILYAALNEISHRSFKAVVISLTGCINEPIRASWFKVKARSFWVMIWFWIPMAFFINTAYRSKLLSNLLALDYEAQINDAEAVLKTNLPIYVEMQTIGHETFTINPTNILKKIYENNVLKNGKLYPRRAFDSTFVEQEVHAGRAIDLKIWQNRQDKDKVIRSKESVLTSFQTNCAAKYSPLTERLTMVVMRHFEGRLEHVNLQINNKWKEDRPWTKVRTY